MSAAVVATVGRGSRDSASPRSLSGRASPSGARFPFLGPGGGRFCGSGSVRRSSRARCRGDYRRAAPLRRILDHAPVPLRSPPAAHSAPAPGPAHSAPAPGRVPPLAAPSHAAPPAPREPRRPTPAPPPPPNRSRPPTSPHIGLPAARPAYRRTRETAGRCGYWYSNSRGGRVGIRGRLHRDAPKEYGSPRRPTNKSPVHRHFFLVEPKAEPPRWMEVGESGVQWAPLEPREVSSTRCPSTTSSAPTRPSSMTSSG